jgi:ectoine hydroxylase-related dioxygenase (phytanoyl-CoA dioxygenase family)
MAVAALSKADIEAYARDGVVCLRGTVSSDWIEQLRAGFERNLSQPSGRASIFYDDAAAFIGIRDAETRGRYTGRHDLAKPRFVADLDTWRSHPEFERFVFTSPVAELAGRTMRSSKANFFLQEIMLKAPGTDTPTPWHHDMPFFPMEGDQTCTVWIPLDPIRRKNGIEYIRGSHRWRKAFLPLDMPDPRAHYGADVSAFSPMPDIDARRHEYDIASWDMEPGDCLIHHGYAVHGAPGNATNHPRRVFIVRWNGDDVRFRRGKHQKVNPTFPDCGLEEGAPMDCAAFPAVWRAA